MTQYKKEVTVCNLRGFHARATAEFVKLADTFSCDIQVSNTDGLIASGKSIMGLLMLGVPLGEKLIIETTGEGAEEALQALEKLVKNKFGETE